MARFQQTKCISSNPSLVLQDYCPYMVTDRDAQGMGASHVKDLRNCHGSPTDLPWTTMDRFADEKIAPRIGLMTVL